MRRFGGILALSVALLAAGACSDDDAVVGGSSTTTAAAGTSLVESATAPATTTTAAAAPTTGTVRLVSQNLLHGIACPADTDGCHLADRVSLFVRQLDEAGCPDLVSVQEANQRMVDLLRTAASSRCGGRYEVVWDDDPGLDKEVVLSTLPVVDSRRLRLPGGFRTALWVRVTAAVGLVDFVSTHLASSSDDRPCDADTCPAPCSVADRLQTCQARMVLGAIDELAHPAAVVVLGGDLNAAVGEPTMAAIRDAGFTDTHLVSGNPECNPASGDQCTSGRDDTTLADMTNAASRQTERIDYLLLGGRRDCQAVAPTGLFNGRPAAGDPTGLAYPSDHTGVVATLSCPVDDEDRTAAAAPTATLPPAPTTTAAVGGGPPDDATAAAITEAYRGLFNGDVTDIDRKLSYLEDADRLREFFIQSYEAVREVAARTRVRIDDIELTTPDRATVTYAILLDTSVVLGPQAGEAVRVGGRWLVSRRTYCGLSTQGAAELPEPCR